MSKEFNVTRQLVPEICMVPICSTHSVKPRKNSEFPGSLQRKGRHPRRDSLLEYVNESLEKVWREIALQGNLPTWGAQAICQMIDWRKRNAKHGESSVKDPTRVPSNPKLAISKCKRSLGPEGRWKQRGWSWELSAECGKCVVMIFLFFFPSQTLFLLSFWFVSFVWKKPKRNMFP